MQIIFNISGIYGYLIIPILFFGCKTNGGNSGAPQDSTKYFPERKKMIEQQIENRGIKNQSIIDAFYKVERHLFVPEPLINYAYADKPLPIGHGQTISQPYIVAFMTDVLNLQPEDKILEIGTGSGYQAAILAELCAEVYSIEICKPLGEQAKSLLGKIGYKNVFVKIGDGFKGWPEKAPFDAIIVTCAPNQIPAPLKEQLKEGGRMIIPVGNKYSQRLIYLIKENNDLRKFESLPVIFVPMIDSLGKRY